jgi:hypothetical protein
MGIFMGVGTTEDDDAVIAAYAEKEAKMGPGQLTSETTNLHLQNHPDVEPWCAPSRYPKPQSRRPMTEAEERLIEAELALRRIPEGTEGRGPARINVETWASAVEHERAPKRTITAEELAVIYAARDWVVSACLRPTENFEQGVAARLVDAVRRLK